MARAVAVGTLSYGAQAYDLSSTNLRALQILHRAILRLISFLSKHTKISRLEQAAALPCIINIVTEAKEQATIKRLFTRQALALIDWDAQRPLQSYSHPTPLAPGH